VESNFGLVREFSQKKLGQVPVEILDEHHKRSTGYIQAMGKHKQTHPYHGNTLLIKAPETINALESIRGDTYRLEDVRFLILKYLFLIL